MKIPVGDVELGLTKGTLNIIAAGISVRMYSSIDHKTP